MTRPQTPLPAHDDAGAGRGHDETRGPLTGNGVPGEVDGGPLVSRADHCRAALTKGRKARTKAARERAWRYGLLRAELTIQQAAWELRVSKRTAERYEARRSREPGLGGS